MNSNASSCMYCLHSNRQCVKSFHTIMAQLSSFERGRVARKIKNSYYLAFYKKCLPIPGLWNESSGVYPAPRLGTEWLLKNQHQVEAQEKAILPLSFPSCLNSLAQRALLFGDPSHTHTHQKRMAGPLGHRAPAQWPSDSGAVFLSASSCSGPSPRPRSVGPCGRGWGGGGNVCIADTDEAAALDFLEVGGFHFILSCLRFWNGDLCCTELSHSCSLAQRGVDSLEEWDPGLAWRVNRGSWF